MNKYQQALQYRNQNQLLRSLRTSSQSIDFCSNDYLGMARNEELQATIEQETKQVLPKKTGSTGSRLLSGNSAYAEELEEDIAIFHGFEAALIFNSGYTANLGLLSCVASREDVLIMDELCHASLIDGARLSKAKRLRFVHNDVEDLERLLLENAGSKFVVVESIYSMDGDICPLHEVVALCKKYDAKLIVDEAHTIGVVGQKGEGYCSYLGLQNSVFACVVTYGKAMGCHGAAILGKQWLKDYLINFCRAFIFTTAPSFHQLAAIRCSYWFLPKMKLERFHLQQLIQYLNHKKKQSKWQWLPSPSQIQAVIIPGNEAVMQVSHFLAEQNIDARGIRYPSVARGKERIRICLHSFNTFSEIDSLLITLNQWKKSKLLSLV